jgi:hypothetical protein
VIFFEYNINSEADDDLNMNEINLDASHQENIAKLNEEDVFCTVKPEEVPPVPENKFLMRKSNLEAESASNKIPPPAKVEDKRFY